MIIPYEIAGLSLQIDSDVPFRCLQTSRFRQFEYPAARRPDIRFQFGGVRRDDMTLPPPDARTRRLLASCVRHPQNDLRSPVLLAPQVQARLHSVGDYASVVGLEIRPAAVTLFDFARRSLEIFYDADVGAMNTECCINAGLLAPFLPLYSAAILHSSSVAWGDAAAVFLARDEGGKTTAARLAPSGTILCDDQNIVRQTRDGFRVSGTPWGRYFNSQHHAQVGGLFLLEQASTFALRPVQPVEVFEFVWREHRDHVLLLPPWLKVQAFILLRTLCCEVPVYRLRFPRDFIDWDAVRAAMRAGRPEPVGD